MTNYCYFELPPGRVTVAYTVTPRLAPGWRGFLGRLEARVDWGVALCGPNDVFDPEVGMGLAEARRLLHLEGRRSLVSRGRAGTFTLDWDEYMNCVRLGVDTLTIVEIVRTLVPKPGAWHKITQH